MTLELPPQGRGAPEEQLAALRDYLVRLAGSLEEAIRGDTAASAAAGRSAAAAREQAARELRAQASALKALIVKNADEITAYADERLERLSSQYVAISDYGSYYRQIEAQVRQTAAGTVESFRFDEAIDALERSLSTLGGQIRRGLIEDPDTHELHLGIAISQSLSFTGRSQTVGGLSYDELSPGQTLGLYTAEGWQFWINGVKRGWFSSQDSMLHISNIVIEERLGLGEDWQLSARGGFGLRYTGG